MIDHNQPYITIIGAGVGGLCMGIQLKKAGFHNFAILEKRSGPGGTWRDNTYPGCACDVPSMFYSFSFETKRDWSRLFPGQAEILGYLEDCVEKHALGPHIRCNVEVARAEFQEQEARWQLELTNGETLRTTVLVSSVGQLNQPAWPDLDGMGRFKGTSFHSAQWEHGSNLSGKRVAVIGNGCSAAQFVPEVAQEAAEVAVFQRSAHWVIPRNDHAFSSGVLKWFQRFPLLVKLYRYFIWLRYEFTLFPIMRRTSKRRAKLEEAAQEHLKATITDAEMIEALTPDYDIGCKRVIIDDTYYPALARDNVSLVTTPISQVTEAGLALADGTEHSFDAIIYGTGFRTNEFLTPMEITGLEGQRLNDAWQDGAEAYMGITVSGFPNFFMTYGPNT
ncbi:MAG: NAD(P)/FAD-dependent oxidoreductase, partial [Gammaproteobacteria bacterium]|nr:NAD(P)/FAD-dependent oxidoreductase [Gammaproteobacteria bacterium]